MTSRWWKKIDGEWREVTPSASPEIEAPAIHGDEMNTLRHPVTDELVNSRNRWNQINREHGLQVVGNDLLSRKSRHIEDKITEERVIDAAMKAEAIASNPDKLNEYRGRNLAQFEMQQRLLNGNR